MAGFTQAWEQNILNRVFRNQAVTFPSTVYVALYTTAPTDTSEGTEVSGGSYARQAVTFGAPSGNPSVISNTANIDFPVATANWGTVVAFAIHSADSGTGNMICWGNLSTSKTIQTDDQARILAGNLQIQLD
jgi:hypothetical protein